MIARLICLLVLLFLGSWLEAAQPQRVVIVAGDISTQGRQRLTPGLTVRGRSSTVADENAAYWLVVPGGERTEEWHGERYLENSVPVNGVWFEFETPRGISVASLEVVEVGLAGNEPRKKSTIQVGFNQFYHFEPAKTGQTEIHRVPVVSLDSRYARHIFFFTTESGRRGLQSVKVTFKVPLKSESLSLGDSKGSVTLVAPLEGQKCGTDEKVGIAWRTEQIPDQTLVNLSYRSKDRQILPIPGGYGLPANSRPDGGSYVWKRGPSDVGEYDIFLEAYSANIPYKEGEIAKALTQKVDLVVSPDFRRAFILRKPGTEVVIWDVANDKQLKSIQLPFPALKYSMQVSQNGKQLVCPCLTQDGKKVIAWYDESRDGSIGLIDVPFSETPVLEPSGTTMLALVRVTERRNKIVRLDLRAGTTVDLYALDAFVHNFRMSNDGSAIVTSGVGGQQGLPEMMIIDARNGKKLWGKQRWAGSGWFTPDGLIVERPSTFLHMDSSTGEIVDDYGRLPGQLIVHGHHPVWITRDNNKLAIHDQTGNVIGNASIRRNYSGRVIAVSPGRSWFIYSQSPDEGFDGLRSFHLGQISTGNP